MGSGKRPGPGNFPRGFRPNGVGGQDGVGDAGDGHASAVAGMVTYHRGSCSACVLCVCFCFVCLFVCFVFVRVCLCVFCLFVFCFGFLFFFVFFVFFFNVKTICVYFYFFMFLCFVCVLLSCLSSFFGFALCLGLLHVTRLV